MFISLELTNMFLSPNLVTLFCFPTVAMNVYEAHHTETKGCQRTVWTHPGCICIGPVLNTQRQKSQISIRHRLNRVRTCLCLTQDKNTNSSPQVFKSSYLIWPWNRKRRCTHKVLFLLRSLRLSTCWFAGMWMVPPLRPFRSMCPGSQTTSG